MFYLYTDGGSRGNPGNSATGCFIFDEEMRLFDFKGKYIGKSTNNNAEYQALIEGLELCKKNNIKELECRLDSELVVNQINGKYKINNAGILANVSIIKKLINQFNTISFFHVLRVNNKFTDKLVNIILDIKEDK